MSMMDDDLELEAANDNNVWVALWNSMLRLNEETEQSQQELSIFVDEVREMYLDTTEEHDILRAEYDILNENMLAMSSVEPYKDY